MGKALLEGSAFFVGWFWEMAAGAENRFGDFLPSGDLRKVFFALSVPPKRPSLHSRVLRKDLLHPR